MNLIKINPVIVAFNTTANYVRFQVEKLMLPPNAFLLNAVFYTCNDNNCYEVANTIFELPLSDYHNWQDDDILINKCLEKLNLQRNEL